MNVTGPHHIAIKVADLVGAEAFYGGVLGLRVQRRWPSADGQGERALWLDLGAGTFLALEKAAPSAANVAIEKAEDAPGMHLLALTIARDQREAWVKKLIEAGHPIYHQTAHTIYVRDPEGNRIGLSHWPSTPSP
jgi:catechol 2,3-dioxygenase-like lactoylglutathione lyase family enzyme